MHSFAPRALACLSIVLAPLACSTSDDTSTDATTNAPDANDTGFSDGNAIDAHLDAFDAHDATTDGAPTDATSDASDASDGGDVPFPGAPTGAGTGTTYYVSPSGDDAHDGKSPATAWKTVEKVNAQSFAGGDSVLFEGGRSFTGCLTFDGSKVTSTPTAAFTVGSYGTGKFTLTANCSGALAAAIKVKDVSGVYVQDAIVVGNAGGAMFGVWLTNTTTTISRGLVVRRCDVSGFYTTTYNFGGEIFISADSGAGMDEIGILDNELHGASGPTSLDDNGVAGYGNSKNIKHVLYQHNLVHDIGGKPDGPPGSEGNGIVVNGVDGATVQYNVTHDLGGNVNTCGGNSGVLVYSANDVKVQFNEAYKIQPVHYTAGCDWDGFDLDGFTTNSVMQYNYSHDNFGEGFLFFGAGTWGPNTARYNISEHDGLLGTTASSGIGISGGPTPMIVNVYNNTVYDNAPDGTQTPAFAFVNGVPTGGVVANNIFYGTAHSFGQSWLVWTNGTNPSGLKFVNNDYYGDGTVVIEWNGPRYTTLSSWQSASGEDPMAMSVDPQLGAPGTGGTCGGWSKTCAAGAYSLKSGSPMTKKGIDLTAAPYSLDVGSQDFFGNPIGGSAGYDVGAF